MNANENWTQKSQYDTTCIHGEKKGRLSIHLLVSLHLIVYVITGYRAYGAIETALELVFWLKRRLVE
jgi:hypothetical protein